MKYCFHNLGWLLRRRRTIHPVTTPGHSERLSTFPLWLYRTKCFSIAFVLTLCSLAPAAEHKAPVLADIPRLSRTAVFLTGQGRLEKFHAGDPIPGTDWRTDIVTGRFVVLEPAFEHQARPDSVIRLKVGEAIPDISDHTGASLSSEQNTYTISGTHTKQNTNYDGADRMLAETQTSATRTWLTDGFGTPVKRLNQDGSTYSVSRYDEYGEVEDEYSPDIPRFGFTGHQRGPVEAPDLYYAQQRWYNAAVGRFISEDPAWGKPQTPPSLHRYLYAYANPTVYMDPDGRQTRYGLDFDRRNLAVARGTKTGEEFHRENIAAGMGALVGLSFYAGGGLAVQGGRSLLAVGRMAASELSRRGVVGAYLGNATTANTVITEGAAVTAAVASGAEVPSSAPISIGRHATRSSRHLVGMTSDAPRVSIIREAPDHLGTDLVPNPRLVEARARLRAQAQIPNNIPVSTAINDGVRFVDQASLPRGIKSTFLDGQYATVETTAPVKLFRKFGGTGNQAKADGGFATTVQNASRSETAVFQQWSNQRFEAQLDIPEGSVLNIGKVAPQTSRSGNRVYHRGRADQVLLPQDYPTSWITTIRDGKTGITYTLDEFRRIFPDQFK